MVYGELHWLKVPERIQFRLGVLAYRCLHNTAPAYCNSPVMWMLNHVFVLLYP